MWVLILSIVMVISSVVFLILFIRSMIKKERARVLFIEVLGCIVFAIISVSLAIPGTKSGFSIRDLEFTIETPSKIAEIIGENRKKLEVKNASAKNPQTLVFSVSSTSPSVSPDLDFLNGKKYIRIIEESKDSREKLFELFLPPGEQLAISSSTAVTFRFK